MSRIGISGPYYKGFTLIEILIVIAVLVLLAAMIFPVFAASRRKAKQTQCVSNLHQIGQAFVMYRSDWDGCWPTSAGFSGDHDHGGWLPIRSYIKGDKDMLACPTAVRIEVKGIPEHIRGYAINSRLHQVLQGTREVNVPFPATTVEFCDAPDNFIDVSDYDPWRNNPKAPDPIPDVSWERHQGGANYQFCDGHVHWYAPDAVLMDTYHVQDGTRPTFALSWTY